MDLYIQREILLNRIRELREEIDQLKINNPWYPARSQGSTIAARKKKLKEVEAKIKHMRDNKITRI
jgi:hypothetical protein